LLSAVASNVMKKQNRDADDPTVQRVTELVPEKCDRTPVQ